MVRRWSAVNARHKTVVSGKAAPHPNDEFLFYQILVGAWPAEMGANSAAGNLEATALYAGFAFSRTFCLISNGSALRGDRQHGTGLNHPSNRESWRRAGRGAR